MDTHPKGVLGFALYIELRKGGGTNQYIFTQALPDPEERNVIKARFYSRAVSAESPRRKWRYREYNTPDIRFDTGTNKIARDNSVDRSRTIVEPIVADINKRIDNAVRTGWALVGSPLIIEITEADTTAIKNARTPDALMRRMTAARSDSRYPENLWDGGPSADSVEFTEEPDTSPEFPEVDSL